jgi:hypothetical protein
MIALLLRISLFLFLVIFIFSGLKEGPWILIAGFALGLYVLSGDIIKLLINIFNSPEWVELNENTLKIKLRYRESFSINVGEVTKIAEASWVKMIASYDRKMICSARKLTLYLGKAEFIGLDEFFNALIKINPKCQVDEFLL